MNTFMERAAAKARHDLPSSFPRPALIITGTERPALHPYQLEARRHALLWRHWRAERDEQMTDYCLMLAKLYRDLYRNMVLGRAGA